MYGYLWSCTQNILPMYWKKSFCTKLTFNSWHIYEYLCISMHTWPHRIRNIPHCLKSWTYCHGECTNMWRAVLSYGYKIKINVHNWSEWKSTSRQNRGKHEMIFLRLSIFGKQMQYNPVFFRTCNLANSRAWLIYSICIGLSHHGNTRGQGQHPGPRLNIKTVLSTYGDFHVKDKTAVRTSYL